MGLGVDFDDVVDYATDNDLGTAVLLQALWRAGFAGRLVVASSMVVYGEGAYTCPTHGPVRPGVRVRRRPRRRAIRAALPGLRRRPRRPATIDEDAPLDPRNTYAATKLHTEHLAQTYAREAGIGSVIALRYHNVYGPRMPRDTPVRRGGQHLPQRAGRRVGPPR